MYSIIFPHLGIKLGEFPNQINIGNFSIAFYGILIAIGIILGCALVFARVKKTNQYSDDYVDMIIFGIIAGIIGARLYYVIFSWDMYKDNIGEIFNLRNGGLAIYGTIIGAFISTFIVTKVKKISFLKVMDTCAPGFLIGQALGRWGNFFNREAFGGYTDSLFAMQIKASEVTGVTNSEILSHMVEIDGTKYIQVHPTFLYESLWCILILVLILIFRNRQKYNGEIMLWYLGGYALGRAWIEGLRTDQLLIGQTMAVSQILSIVVVVAVAIIIIITRVKLSKGWQPNFKLVLEPGDVGTKEYAQARIKAKKEKKAGEWEKVSPEKEEPVEEKVEEVKEEPAEEKVEEVKEEPVEEKTEEVKEEPTEEKAEEVKEEPVEEKTEEVKEEPAEEKVEEVKESVENEETKTTTED